MERSAPHREKGKLLRAMKGQGAILSLLVVGAITAGALGDVSSVPLGPCELTTQSPAEAGHSQVAATVEDSEQAIAGGLLDGPVAAGSLPAPSPDRPMRAVIQTPSRSGSASLLLCAFGSMCAWRVTRSARKFHLGAMPEWYHTGGPTQIGQATPVDLDFSALPVQHFDQPAEQSPPPWRLEYVTESRCRPQWHPVIGAPRAPPHLS